MPGVKPSSNEMMSSRESGHRARDQYLLIGVLLGFGMWLGSIGPLRAWASGTGPRSSWVLGVAPSFFAAWTFAFWQAFAVKARPLSAAAYATALVAATEVVQLVLPRYLEGAFHHYTADIWDVAAGAVGAGAALLVLLWRAKAQRGAVPG